MKTKLSETASKFLNLIESDSWPVLFSHDPLTQKESPVVSITGDDLEELSKEEVNDAFEERGTSLEAQADLWKSEHGLHLSPGSRFFSDGAELFVLVKNNEGTTGWINPF